MTTARRKAIPVGVKLHAALLLLGFTEDEIASGLEWDHHPALALRFVDPETGELVPPANDPAHLRPLRKAEHKAKTSGRKGEKRSTSAGSDIHAVAHVRRLERKNADFVRAMAAKGDAAPAPAKRKRAWPSRPFQKRGQVGDRETGEPVRRGR